jgi:hypothetical protein
MKRILALMLALLMVVSCFMVSCGEDETETQAPVDETEATGNETETETETEETLQHPQGWANNDKMVIAGYTSYIDYTKDWVVDGPSSDTMVQAVWDRNLAIENYMGGRLDFPVLWYTWADMDNYNNNIINSVKANNQQWDVIAPITLQASFHTISGICRNLEKIESLDLNHSWYNQGMREATAMYGQLFNIASLGSISTVKSILRIFVNEDRVDELKLTSIYDLVDAGEWTFDKIREYQIAGSEDVGNDGNWVLSVDRLGLKFVHTKFQPAWLYAAGLTFTYVDNNGRIQITDLTQQKVIDCHDRVKQMVRHYGNKGNGAPGSVNVGDYTGEVGWKSFVDGYDMMYFIDGRNIDKLRTITSFTWGAVPMPKWDKAQENYYSINDEEQAVFEIPLDVDKEAAGKLLETFSYIGYTTTYPTYVQDVLYTKASTTEQAASMYDIMMNGLVYDFAYMYNIAMADGGFATNSLFWRFRNHTYNTSEDDWVSYWMGYKESFDTGLKDLLDVKLAGLAD